jgi:hydrogenase/urease accessory protein HupE
VDASTYDVLWKVPALGEDRRLALDLGFAPGTRVLGRPGVDYANHAFVQRWRVRRDGGLDGTRVEIHGLEATLTDVLVRVERLDGNVQTLGVHPSAPAFEVAASPGRADVVATYAWLGVTHILGGFDHLLFVLALVILVRDTRRLLWTITAFTAAHSLTLACATLGWVHVPAPPVEASIALSIAFLASEILQVRAGRPGLTSRAPWLVAFAFGLLHGLGFAGALADIGLPANAIPLALLCFNLGVEAGQVLFIAAVLLAWAAFRRLPVHALRLERHAWLARVPAYAIGTLAMYWTIERIAVF